MFYTECSDFKRSAIQRVHNGAYANRPPSSFFMFENTASLIEQVAKTVDVTMVDVAVVQILFCGILCKNVSGLTTTPRSVLDPNGKSGSSFLELNNYLKHYTWADRPDVIILECVARLRRNQPEATTFEKGTVSLLPS